MITIKTPQEIKILHQGGKILADILRQVVKSAKPGVKTIELDQLAEKLIIEKGGIPSFKDYKNFSTDPAYPNTICSSVNEQLVHTLPSVYELKLGDILSIDIGMKYPVLGQGLFTDMAVTVPIGKIPELTKILLKVTEKSLELGIRQVRPGNRISDISRAVQEHVESHNFSIIRQLVGHGVGYQVHEEPRIPNYVDKTIYDVELKEGMVLAIEPMVSIGNFLVKTLDDGWTAVMADGSLCAHFEHTVAVTKKGVKILTK